MPSFVAFEEIVPSFASFVAFVASLPWDPSVQVQVQEQTHELDFPSSFFNLQIVAFTPESSRTRKFQTEAMAL